MEQERNLDESKIDVLGLSEVKRKEEETFETRYFLLSMFFIFYRKLQVMKI